MACGTLVAPSAQLPMMFRFPHACRVCALVAVLPTLAQAAEAPTPTAIASPGPADDDRDIWARHPVAMELHFGLGSPASIFGLEVEYSSSPLVAVAAGIGMGGYGPSGGTAVHGAGLVRLRPVRAGTADGGPSCGSTTLLTLPAFDLAVGYAF